MKPKNKSKNAPYGTPALEAFFKELELSLFQRVDKYYEEKTKKKESSISSEIDQLLRNLRETSRVVVPTDKTNSFKLIEIEEYKTQVFKHLQISAIEVPRSRLVEISKNANELLSKVSHILNDKEREYIQETIDSKAVPTPKLLIKDHKKPDPKGNFPTRLICPASNFTAGFPKIGYIGIKEIFDKEGIIYDNKTIVQASELKEEIEKLDLRKNETTTISLDIVSMYPSITFSMVKKAIKFYAKNLKKRDKDIIKQCLEMIKFGMGNTLLTFVDKYYEYAGSKSIDERGLTIGGYESAWLADLVASFILDNAKDLFENTTHYYGIYRDDGIIFLKGLWTNEMIFKWIKTFQIRANDILCSRDLLFTTEIWNPSEGITQVTKIDETFSTVESASFPFLDMELSWAQDEMLTFKVHMKENQVLKYLNKGSCHTSNCFKAIPNGVFKRLSKLTSKTASNLNSKLDKLYPDHAKALRTANLAPSSFPTMKEIIEETECENEKKNAKEKKKRSNSRQVYFCIGQNKVWGGKHAIHAKIKTLRNKYNLKWLRTSMSYHKFSNLREQLQADLGAKLMKGIGSLDFDTLQCNCNARSKVNGKCPYNNICRQSIVVYKATCDVTKKFYIGNTQQKLKARMTQHFNETKDAANNGSSTDSFAKHFAHQDIREGETTVKQVRDRTTIEILWKGNAISCSKSFGKISCSLCMKERLEILKASKQQPKRLINSCNELYGACRHRPVFHRYTNYTKSADEGHDGLKRVDVRKSSEIPKRGRGRPKKGTVFKIVPISTKICTEIILDDCTNISPLSFNGKSDF